MNDTTTIPDVDQTEKTPEKIIETDLPGRLDRLPWGRFHTLIVAALGITWLLDGLEVTLAGAVASALKTSHVLQFSNADVGIAGSARLEDGVQMGGQAGLQGGFGRAEDARHATA